MMPLFNLLPLVLPAMYDEGWGRIKGAAFLCSEAGRFISGCVLPYRFHG